MTSPTTPRDAIAGLSERLRFHAAGEYGYRMVFNGTLLEAATQLDALRADNQTKEQAITDMARTIDAQAARLKELEAERDTWRDQAKYETDVAHAAADEIERLTVQNAALRALVKDGDDVEGERDRALSERDDILKTKQSATKRAQDFYAQFKAAEARATRAEQERDMLQSELDTSNDNHRAMAAQLARVGQERDEAYERAALQAEQFAPSHSIDPGKCHVAWRIAAAIRCLAGPEKEKRE